MGNNRYKDLIVLFIIFIYFSHIVSSDSDVGMLGSVHLQRTRRGFGYRMKCVPQWQKVCKRFFGKKFCVTSRTFYCTALDWEISWNFHFKHQLKFAYLILMNSCRWIYFDFFYLLFSSIFVSSWARIKINIAIIRKYSSNTNMHTFYWLAPASLPPTLRILLYKIVLCCYLRWFIL